MAFPNRDVGYLLRGYVDIPGLEEGSNDNNAVNVTCQQAQSFLHATASSSSSSTDVCQEARTLLAGVCGCPSTAQTPCLYCGDEPLPDPDRMIYYFKDFDFPAATCHDIRLYVYQEERDTWICQEVAAFGYLCGCEDSSSYRNNFRNRIRWIPKLGGIISILGSSYILWDTVLRQLWKRQSLSSSLNLTVFQQLLSIISICDLAGSIAFVLSTIPMPKYVYSSSPRKFLNSLAYFQLLLSFAGTMTTGNLPVFRGQRAMTLLVLYRVA